MHTFIFRLDRFNKNLGGKMITLNCKDGELELDGAIYCCSYLVRDLVDNTQRWIATHTKDEVLSEIEELYYK